MEEKQARQSIPAVEQRVYVDKQGREVPLLVMLEQGEPVYIQAEQLSVQQLSTDTLHLSTLDKTLHFTFMRQGKDERAFVLTQITDNHDNRQQFLYGQDSLNCQTKYNDFLK